MLIEQKRLMHQIYEEKRKLAEEKAKLDAAITSYKDNVYHDSLSKMNVEAELTVNSKRLQDEKIRLDKLSMEIREREASLKQQQLSLNEKKQELDISMKKLEQSDSLINQKLSLTNELYQVIQ